MNTQIAISLVVAMAAAVRGNWSPCGESLQAQIHPMGERSRGNTWLVTVLSFTIASAVAGAVITGLLASIGSALTVSGQARLAVTAVASLVAGLLDLRGIRPWTPERQVNENWIGRYRGWAYGAGFGFQLGVGFSVFVMSWGYYAMLLGALLSGSKLLGLMIGAVFGLGRGILLYMARGIDSPTSLARFHAKTARLKAPAFVGSAWVMALVSMTAIL